MNDPALVLLSVLAALGVGAVACYGLYTMLVAGGRFADWLEAHRWIYLTVFAVGCALLVAAFTLALWPLAPLGGAMAFLATARYLWLNV